MLLLIKIYDYLSNFLLGPFLKGNGSINKLTWALGGPAVLLKQQAGLSTQKMMMRGTNKNQSVIAMTSLTCRQTVSEDEAISLVVVTRTCKRLLLPMLYTSHCYRGRNDGLRFISTNFLHFILGWFTLSFGYSFTASFRPSFYLHTCDLPVPSCMINSGLISCFCADYIDYNNIFNNRKSAICADSPLFIQ